MSGGNGVEQDETVTAHVFLSLVVPLPVEQETLTELRTRMARACAIADIATYELLLVESIAGGLPDGAETSEVNGVSTNAAIDTGNGNNNGKNGRNASVSAAASLARTRIIAPDPAEAMSGRSAALLAAQQAAGEVIVILEGNALQRLPSVETLASLFQGGGDAEVVIASRYLPGADDSPVTNSRGLVRDLRSWLTRSTDTLTTTVFFPRLRHCTDSGSGLYLMKRSVIQGMQDAPAEPAKAAKSEAPSLLLTLLVRGKWHDLVETPYRSDEEEEEVVAPPHRQVSLRELRALRRGPRSRGRVRYRYQHLPPGPYDPEPLDDELPDSPEDAGKRRRRLLWTVALLALALRIILLPIGHWWDLTVDYNTFIDLIHNHSPYDTMQYLSHIAWASHWDYNYEYYAYPPVMLYIYYPLAHLYGWLHPTATYYIPVSGAFAMPSLSFDFFFLLKFPVWIADFLIAALLARMSGTVRGFRDYLLNPYVLLVSGAWTFDAIMVLGLLLAVYFLQRGKLASSGLALAFGTMVKFIPAVAAPTIVLYLIKKKRPLHEIVIFLVAYGVACVIMLGPFLQGVLYVVNFHSNRVGGGMNWEMFWRLSTFFPKHADLDPLSLAIGAFGTPTLVIVLLLAYWYCFTAKQMSLNRMILVTLLAFLIGSKLVNEQYALVLLPFAFIQAWRVGGAWRWLARLLWIVPLLYAIMRVPIDRFLWLFYRSILGASAKAIAVTARTGFSGPFVPWANESEQQMIILVLSVGFTVLCLVAFFWPEHKFIRPYRHLQAVESAGEPAGVAGAEATDEEISRPEPAIALQ
jgi:hypothetical protein